MDTKRAKMTGLPNLGNTCYINAILQCFRFSKAFINKIQDLPPVKYSNLTFRNSFISLMQTECTETDLKIFVTCLYRKFTPKQQEDAHECFIHIVDTLFGDAPGPFKGTFKSTIHLSCGHISETFNAFTTISLPINDRSVLRMFNNFKKKEALDDLIMCDTCKKKRSAYKNIDVEIPPAITVIQMKRFVGMDKNTDLIGMSPDLNIGGKMFTLYAICDHWGDTRNYGHYTSVVLRKNSKWKHFDDNIVSRLYQIPTMSESSYLLFYMQQTI